MIRRNLYRQVFVLIIGVVVSSVVGYCGWEDVPLELPRTLFEVQGILFPVALALVTSMDFLRVRNKDFRLAFRANIKRVRKSLIIQFTFALLAIGAMMLIGDSDWMLSRGEIYFFPRLTASIAIAYSIFYTIYNFIAVR